MALETAAREAQVQQPSDTSLNTIVRITQAHMERGRYSWIWVVLRCPYCGKPHDHYAGPLDGDPYLYLGQMLPAHCDRADRRRLLIHHPDRALWYVLAAS
jgi:hypothetical protein